MVAPTTLLLALLSATAASALEVQVRRFAMKGCVEKNHIRKDMKISAPHCQTFDHHEPEFESYKVYLTDEQSDVDKKLCKASVFDEEGCKGQEFTYGDIKDYMSGRCANNTIDGRSIKITCAEHSHSIISSKMPPTTSSTSFTLVSKAPRPPVTVTHVVEAPTPETTITLVPAQSSEGCCSGNQ